METENIEGRAIFVQKLQYYVNISGKSQKEIAEDIGVSESIFSDWIKGKKFPRIEKIDALAKYFDVSKSDLIENVEVIKIRDNADSRDVFCENLRLLMAKAGKSRNEVSSAIGVSYYTFSDWCNGKKYPRIENLETLAKYFDITVSDLVDKKQKESIPNDKDEVLEIILKLHTDKEFFSLVEKMRNLDSEKLKVLNQFLNAFGYK